MCKKATCATCSKFTWWGCGSHVPAVVDQIPQGDRCTCEPKVEKEGKQYPPSPAFGMVKAAFGFGGGSKDGKGEEEL